MKIGIIGFGGIGALHAAQLAQSKIARVGAIVEPDDKRRSIAEVTFKGKDVALFSDLPSALERSSVDGWIVASSTASHVKITHKLLSSGQIVLLEKPIAQNFEEALKLSDLVNSDSANLMLGHTLLWSKEFQSLKVEIAKMGAIQVIRCSRRRSADHRTRYPGESPFSLTMVHDLYMVHNLMAGEEPEKFSAQVHRHEEGGVDLAQGQMMWNGNVFASLVADYLVPDGIEGGGSRDEIFISGQGWEMNLAYDSGIIGIVSEGILREVVVGKPIRSGATNYFEDALRSEQEHFIDVIQAKAAVPVGARYSDACQIQGWIENFVSLTDDKGGPRC